MARAASRAPNTTAASPCWPTSFRRQAAELAERHRLPAQRQPSGSPIRPSASCGWWEGEPATPELPHGVYRIDPMNGELDDGAGRPGGQQRPGIQPPTNQVLYVVESRAKPHRLIWAYDVAGDRAAQQAGLRQMPSGHGRLRRHRAVDDANGNVWCGLGQRAAPSGTDPQRRWTACASTTRAGRSRWRTSTCPSAARTSASAAPKPQPALHGQQPFAVRAVRQHPRRGVAAVLPAPAAARPGTSTDRPAVVAGLASGRSQNTHRGDTR